MFPPRANANHRAGRALACDSLGGGKVAIVALEVSPREHQQEVSAMRFILGLIVGVALMIGGAWIHDNVGSGASKQLVNWTTANEMQQATIDYVRSQIDRLMGMIKGGTST